MCDRHRLEARPAAADSLGTPTGNPPPVPDQPLRHPSAAHVALQTTEPMSAGHGFISGLASALLGIGRPRARARPSLPGVRRPSTNSARCTPRRTCAPAIHVTLVASFLLGTVSAFLRANKALALTGIGFTLVAAVLGGSQVPSGAGPSGHSVLARRRLLRPEPAALLGRVRARSSGSSRSGRTARLPAAVAGGPVVLLRQLAAGRSADGAHADASARPVRLGRVARDRGTVERAARWRCRCSRWCWWRTSRSTGSTARSTSCRSCGPSTRFTTRSKRWTGSRARGCTWWT